MGTKIQAWLDGRHAHLIRDDGLGWIVVYRHEVLDPTLALSNPSGRIRRLAKAAAIRNPVGGAGSGPEADQTSFVWPQRGSDKGG